MPEAPMTSARVADSVERVPPSRIRELANVAMGMDDVIPLYFGESNLPTPQLIKDAATRALNDGCTYYTENTGIPSLRREIAGATMRLHGVELDPERRDHGDELRRPRDSCDRSRGARPGRRGARVDAGVAQRLG